MVDVIFWNGVEFLKWLENILGLSYQEINVYLFIIFHPLLTLILLVLWLTALVRNKKS